MQSRDVSIEYAHIYTNHQIGKEQELSVEILGTLTQEERQHGHTLALLVMVDDYSFPDPSFDYATFATFLGERGFAPDCIIRESQLIPQCDQVLHMLHDQKLKEQLSDYIRVKKYPCSLFIAAWYFVRFGILTHDSFDPVLQAKRLINILPLSFQPFEDKALDIIRATSHAERVSDIDYRYFEGRLVA